MREKNITVHRSEHPCSVETAILLRNTCSCGTPVPLDPLLAVRAITCEIAAPGNLAATPSVQISATRAYERCAMLRRREVACEQLGRIGAIMIRDKRSLRSITTHHIHNTAHSAMHRSNSDRSSAILRWIAARFVASWMHAGSRNMETVT